jgi:hypothetical protein
VWERLGLDTSKHPEIKRYRIQWFSGRWSKWYTPGKDDIDWKGSDRRVWSYFTDHSHEVEQCTVSYDRPEITVTIAPSSAEVGDKLNIEWDGCPDKEMVEVTLYRIAGKPGSVKKGSFPKSLPVEPKPSPLPPPKSKPKTRPKPGKKWSSLGWLSKDPASKGKRFHHQKVGGRWIEVGSADAKRYDLAASEATWMKYKRGTAQEQEEARKKIDKEGLVTKGKWIMSQFQYATPGNKWKYHHGMFGKKRAHTKYQGRADWKAHWYTETGWINSIRNQKWNRADTTKQARKRDMTGNTLWS